MRRTSNERGSTLIMLIGVIAALAIMAASLVALVMNVSANTGHQRTQVKAFDIAEAGLDNGLYVLGKSWPNLSTSTAPAIDETQFLSQFAADEFPQPTNGQKLVDVHFYDNAPYSFPYSAYDRPHFDANVDKMMWIDATATVGNRSVRVRALAQQQNAKLNLPFVVIYAGGGIWMHGGGTPVGVVPGGLPPDSSTVTAYYGEKDGVPYLEGSGSADFSAQVIPRPTVRDAKGKVVPSADDLISPDMLALLKQTAINTGRYFTDVNAAENALGTGPLVYLKTTGDVKITANGTFNGNGYNAPSASNPKPPGILIVDGGGVTFDGTPTFYGLVYCTSGFVDVGHAHIIGMVISASGVSELGGSDQVLYDEHVRSSLDNVITLSARVVPGTWRQLSTN